MDFENAFRLVSGLILFGMIIYIANKVGLDKDDLETKSKKV